MYEGTWAVVYENDTILTQKDTLHPEYSSEACEVPFKAIEWSRVQRVLFHSSDDTTEFTFHKTPDWDVAMRSRVFFTDQKDAIRAFMVTISTPGEEVSPESVQRVLYWFPNGVVHDCKHFDCHEVAQWASGWVHGKVAGLMPLHDDTAVAVDAELISEVSN